MTEEITFEASMKRLEEIVRLLEQPELPLAESVALYKEGTECMRYCRDKLQKASHEIEIWQNGEAAPFAEDEDGAA